MNITMKLGAVLATAMAVSVIALSAQAEMTLSYTDASANRGDRADAMVWFADELEKRTDGEVKMELHWGGALLKGPDALKGVGDGAADMGLVISTYNPALNPAMLLADIPNPLNDPWAATRALYELNLNNPVLQKEWEDANVKFITTMSTGPLQMVCKDTVIDSVDDFEGVKMKGIGVFSKVAYDLGANVIEMPAYDTYQGLDTGLVDCAIFYTYAIPAFKLPEVTTELTLLDWGALMGIAVVINKDAYAALTPQQQAILEGLGAEFVDVISQKMVVNKNATIEALKGDLEFHEFPAEERQKLLAASAKHLDEWKARVAEAGIDGGKLSDTYDALLEKWHQKLDADGYPWAQ